MHPVESGGNNGTDGNRRPDLHRDMFRRVHVHARLGLAAAAPYWKAVASIGQDVVPFARDGKLLRIPLGRGHWDGIEACRESPPTIIPRGVRCRNRSCLPKPRSCSARSSRGIRSDAARPASSSRDLLSCKGMTATSSTLPRCGKRPNAAPAVPAARHAGNGCVPAFSHTRAIRAVRMPVCFATSVINQKLLAVLPRRRGRRSNLVPKESPLARDCFASLAMTAEGPVLGNAGVSEPKTKAGRAGRRGQTRRSTRRQQYRERSCTRRRETER